MKRSEVSILLTKIAAFDQRTIGNADVEAWSEALGDAVGLADSLDAVTKHFRSSADRLMPIHILNAAGGIRRDRLQRAGIPPIPGDLSWKQEKEWRQLWCAKVKDGLSSEQATSETNIAMRIHELPAVEIAVAKRTIEAFANRPRPAAKNRDAS